MPRLNVYIPSDLADLATKWRPFINLSEICARAIRDELSAIETDRQIGPLARALRPLSPIEGRLASMYGMVEVRVSDTDDANKSARDVIGASAAAYIDEVISDGTLLALAGGRQMWSVVRNLSPRRVRATVTALGFHQADPEVLHVHPNSLTTVLSLLYSPRTSAHIIGTTSPHNLWTKIDTVESSHPRYLVISSCSEFSSSSPIAKLLGPQTVSTLEENHVFGDFAYNFLTSGGDDIKIDYDGPHFLLTPATLRLLTRRSDARTILVAGGNDKVRTISLTLSSKLCNTLITDTCTAEALLSKNMGSRHDRVHHPKI